MAISRIKTDGIEDAAISTAKIADAAINSAKIGVDVIAAEDLAANSITVSEISNGAVTPAKLSTGAPNWDTSGNVTLSGNFSVTSGTIKLDGNYPVGTNNVALGDAALNGSLTGSENVAVGTYSLDALTSGAYNSGLGYGTLSSTTTGSNNSAVGNGSLISNTSGSYNAALGVGALQANTTGIDNTAVGYQAGYSNTTNSYNTYLGDHAGYAATNWKNTFLGHASGEAVTTGGSNTIIGRYDGNQGGLDIRTQNNVVVLSDGDGNPRVVVNSSGQTFLNHASLTAPVVGTEKLGVQGGSGVAIAAQCNVRTGLPLFLSNTDNATNTYLAQFATGSGGDTRGEIYFNGSSLVYATASDYRLKENVSYTFDATSEVKKLKPAKYTWIESQAEDIGFLAHEVAEVFPNAVGGEKDGVDEKGKIRPQVYDPSKLVPLLVKTIQELEARITALEGN